SYVLLRLTQRHRQLSSVTPYLYTTNPPWNPTRFYEEGITDAIRKYMGTLWNVYSFFVLYANIDEYRPSEHNVLLSKRADIDRWIISKFNNTTAKIRSDMDKFNITDGGKALEAFVDELSNWYVRRSRRRYWGSGRGLRTRRRHS
ncbi:MAG: class I tRNA ligase family protein, partial [Anaerotruncus sp.]|nr:class I tRNA ligase family protein [Anaerotruncus sp.]